MRFVAKLALILALCAPCFGQGNSVTITNNGAPPGGAGKCAFVMYYINSATGDFYDCNGSTWHLVGPGAAGAAAWSTLTAGTNSNAGTFAVSANTWDFSAATVFKVASGTHFLVLDPADNTKKVQFDLSNISTLTTRTVNIPDANSTTVQADTGTANNFFTAMSAQGVFSKARPACATLSDSGTLCASSAALAVTIAQVAHKWLDSYTSSTGAFTQSQPACADLSNAGTLCQSSAALAATIANVSHKWLNSYTASTGAFTQTQPACADLSDAGVFCNGTAYSSLTGVPSTFAPTAHSLLGASHGDTLTHTVVLGDVIFGNSTPAWAALAGNITSTKKFLAQTGTGSVSAAPAWATISGSDLPVPGASSLGGVDSKDCTGTGHVLSVNTDGSITCSADAGGGGGASTADAFITVGHPGDLTAERNLAGTAHHVTVTDGGANGDITLDTGDQIPTLPGNNVFTGNNTLTAGQNQVAAYKVNNVLTLDGVKYTTLQGLLTDANTLCTGATNCILDARAPGLGTQTLTSGALPAVPTTLLTGPYTIKYDMTAFTGLQPSSHFRMVADNTTITNTTTDPASQACLANTPIGGMIAPVVTNTTASTTSGSATVTVASATGIELKTLVAILGRPFDGSGTAGFQIGTQSTTITNVGGQLIGDTSMTVGTTTNFGPASAGALYYDYLLVGSEYEQYTGSTSTTFTSMSRGLFGSSAAAHAQTSVVTQVGFFVCEVAAISGTTLTCVDKAPMTVTSAPAQVGSTDISIEGSLTLDGALDSVGHSVPLSGCTQPTAIGNWLTSHLSMGTSIEIQNFDAGVSGFMSRRNLWQGDFVNVGVIGLLAVNAASVTTNVATLTIPSNPVSDGFVVGGAVTVSGFTGADTYFNGSFTLLSVTATQVTYTLTHANASASTTGQIVQTNPPVYNAGWDVGLFNAMYNTVNTQGHSGGYFQLLLDDRSVIAGPYNGPSSFNSAALATDDGQKYRYGCVDVEGSSSFNRVDMAYCNASVSALQLVNSAQWTTDPNQTGNTIFAGSLDSSVTAINIVDQNGGVTRNTVYVGLINSGIITVPSTGRDFVCFAGSSQVFNCSPYISGSAFLWTMLRSQGNVGFPDITGTGAAALVLGDSFGVKLGTSAELTLSPSVAGHAPLNDPSGTTPTSPVAGDQWRDANGTWTVDATGVAACNVLTDSTQSETANNIKDCAPSSVTTAYQVNRPAAATSGTLVNVTASNVVTQSFSGDAAHSISQLAKTAAVTTFTLCAATANTACGQAGQYRISYNFYGSGTACTTVTAGSVGLNLTWTDTNAVTHTTISLPLWDQKAAAMTNGVFNFNTALGTESASGSYIISTNGTIIQAATTYVACTSGTGTYNLKMTVEQLQ